MQLNPFSAYFCHLQIICPFVTLNYFLFFIFEYFKKKKYFLYKRILGNLELSYNKLKYLKSFFFFFINGNEQRQKEGRLKHTMMQSPKEG